MKLKPKRKTPNGINADTVQPSSGSAPGRSCPDQQGHLDRHQATAVTSSKKNAIKIGTWNVRTLFMVGQLNNLKQEMETLDIDILGVCETRWTGNGCFTSDNVVMLYSGGETHSNSVGVIMKKHIAKSIIGCWSISDRVMVVKLKGTPADVNIIQAYAPTSASTEDALENFYHDLEKAMSVCKSSEMKIVMGDFNAKIGEERYNTTVGPYGLGTRNDRGDTMVEWCERTELVVTNTWFKQHKRRLYTWTSPDAQTKNQIDFILVNQRYRNAIKSCKTYPGTDCNSDHNLLLANIVCKMRKMKKPKMAPNTDLSSLRTDADLLHSFSVEVKNRFEQIAENNESTAEEDWGQITEILQSTAQQLLPSKPRDKKQKWMNDHILELMKKRRSVKNKNTGMYKDLNTKIQAACRAAKESWIEEQCNELEDLEKRDVQLMYNRIKTMSKKSCRPANTAIKTKNGEVVVEQQDILDRWTEYIGDLFEDTGEMLNFDTNDELSGNEILQSEVEIALKEMKSGKLPGNDNITTELLNACKDTSIRKLCTLSNKIYRTGEIPKQMKESVFIPLPKKGDLLECGNYRLISLMSHITKLILRVIMRRIRNKLLPEISEEQFGFKKDCGTRNAIFVLRILAERSIEMQVDIHMAFVDYEKAFDRVNHEILMQDLKQLGIDDKDLRLLNNLYKEQIAAVLVNGELSEWAQTDRGVRQGCVLSPDLFSLYAEYIMRKVNTPESLKVNGSPISNIRYAEDTVLMADSAETLQQLLSSLQAESRKRGLIINKKKTKIMVINKKSEIPQSNIFLDEQKLEQKCQFEYLGSLVTSDCRCDKEIIRRIALAKKAFTDKKAILADKKLDIALRLRLLKCYVWSTLLYGCESWTLNTSCKQKLEAMEIWCYRRMLRISWVKKISNERVLEMVNMIRDLLITIRQRQLRFVGHVARKNGIEKLVLEGKVAGQRQRGRRRLNFMGGLASAVGCSAVEVIRRTGDRNGFRRMIADVSPT